MNGTATLAHNVADSSVPNTEMLCKSFLRESSGEKSQCDDQAFFSRYTWPKVCVLPGNQRGDFLKKVIKPFRRHANVVAKK